MQKGGSEVGPWPEHRYVHVARPHALLEDGASSGNSIDGGTEVIRLRERLQHYKAKEYVQISAKAEIGRGTTVSFFPFLGDPPHLPCIFLLCIADAQCPQFLTRVIRLTAPLILQLNLSQRHQVCACALPCIMVYSDRKELGPELDDCGNESHLYLQPAQQPRIRIRLFFGCNDNAQASNLFPCVLLPGHEHLASAGSYLLHLP